MFINHPYICKFEGSDPSDILEEKNIENLSRSLLKKNRSMLAHLMDLLGSRNSSCEVHYFDAVIEHEVR